MSGHKILLIIADDKSIQCRLRALFEPAYAVLTGGSVQDALSFLRTNPDIHLAIVDVLRPAGGGLSVLEALRGILLSEPLPVLLCLDPGDEEGQARALDAGLADFVARPWSAPVLRRRVERLLCAGAEAVRERRYRAALLSTARLMDRQKRLETALRRRADTDPVCSLFNRRAAQERIANLLANNPQRTFAFFLLDIDNFKLVNDSFGHIAGDQVLFAISRALRETFRVSDLVGRLGGDEFVVFMHYHGEEALVRQKAAAAVQAIRRLAFLPYPALKLSVSMGVCLSPKDGSSFQALYRHADQALYRIKSLSKDGYALYGDEKSKA